MRGVTEETMPGVLEREQETYEREREYLLAEHRGEFVLIHDGKVIDFFRSEGDAVDAGYRRLGLVPFLVKEIVEVERPRRLISHFVVSGEHGDARLA